MAFTSGLAAAKDLYSRYKINANNKNHAWKINFKQFLFLTKNNCHYCGLEPATILTRKQCNGNYTYNGIDRLDNSNGYSLDNSVTCCKYCNFLKGTLPIFEWQNKLKKNIQQKFRQFNCQNKN